MTADLWMPYIMLMLVSMTLTLTQGQWVGKQRQKNQCCMLSTSKPVIGIKLAATVGLLFFYVTLTLTLQTFISLVNFFFLFFCLLWDTVLFVEVPVLFSFYLL